MKNRKPLELLLPIAFQELSSRWGVMMVTNKPNLIFQCRFRPDLQHMLYIL